jgi:hypothetical protein
VAPNPGATTKSKVTFTVELKNLEIEANDVGEMKEADKGHLHFSTDKGRYDYPKYSGTAGKYSPAVSPTITYADLPKGKHTLVAMLANNDSSPAGPKASITFTVT